MTTADGLWALRYPETHGLYVLERRRGGHHGDRHLDHSGTAGHLGVTRTIALPHEPRHRLRLSDLRPEAAESQQTS